MDCDLMCPGQTGSATEMMLVLIGTGSGIFCVVVFDFDFCLTIRYSESVWRICLRALLVNTWFVQVVCDHAALSTHEVLYCVNVEALLNCNMENSSERKMGRRRRRRSKRREAIIFERSLTLRLPGPGTGVGDCYAHGGERLAHGAQGAEATSCLSQFVKILGLSW
jgi:hypothetical protein